MPIAERIAKLPMSFLIALVLIAASSIPPLLGQDPLALLIGAVWGLNVGFWTVVCGIFIGETIAFMAYRYFLEQKAQEFREHHEEHYGTFVKIVEEGSYPLIWLIRLSFLPTHFTTVFFATLPELSYIGWAIAFWLSCFKYLVPVYAGYCIVHNKSSAANIVGIVLSIVVTLGTLAFLIVRYKAIKNSTLEDSTNSTSDVLNHLESQPTDSIDLRHLEQTSEQNETDNSERKHLLSHQH